MAICSMLCTYGLLLQLVGKGQLLVYPGASYDNGKLGDSTWESHHKSSAHGVRKANTPPSASWVGLKHWTPPPLIIPRVSWVGPLPPLLSLVTGALFGCLLAY